VEAAVFGQGVGAALGDGLDQSFVAQDLDGAAGGVAGSESADACTKLHWPSSPSAAAASRQ
jgi:hypothetical protein